MGDARIFVTFCTFSCQIRAQRERNLNFKSQALLSKKPKGGGYAVGGAVPAAPAFWLLPAHTRCQALVPCSAAGCAILHAPPPCLSTGGRIGCDRRPRFPLPTVCLLVVRPPPTLPSKHAGLRICTLPHRSRRDTGARALISQFLRAYAQCLCLQILCRSAIDFAHPPSTCRRSRGCIRRCRRRRQKPRFATGASMRLELLHCRLDGSAVFLMRSEPFSPTPRRPPGRATLKPRPMAQGTPGI